MCVRTVRSVQRAVAAVSSVWTVLSVQHVFAAIAPIWTVVAVQRAIAPVMSVRAVVAIQVVVAPMTGIGAALAVQYPAAAAVSSVRPLGAHASLHAPPATALVVPLALALQAGAPVRVTAPAVHAAPVLVVLVVVVVVAAENSVVWGWGAFNQVDGNFSSSLYRLMKDGNKNVLFIKPLF